MFKRACVQNASKIRCSKTASTTVLPEITCLLWITKNLWEAFWEIKELEDDSGCLPFSDLALFDMVEMINKDLAQNIERFSRIIMKSRRFR